MALKLLNHLRAGLSRDPDLRRVYWLAVLCRRPKDRAHEALVQSLLRRGLEKWGSSGWATDDERTIIRTLFRLYRAG